MRGLGLFWKLAALAMSAVVLAGCGGDDESRTDPPNIEYGVDMAEMGMPVVDPRYTVAILPEGEEDWILFDDVGEFLKYMTTRDGMTYDAMWVHDFNDESWVSAEEAWYLESRELTSSPMGWGVATFKDEESALAAQEEFGGELYTWETVLDETWDRPPGPGE